MASPAGGLLLVLLVSCQSLANAFDASGISFESSETAVYDTAPKIRIKGYGFSSMSTEIDLLELELAPALPKSDYKASVKDDTTIVLDLAPSKTWVTYVGEPSTTFLELKSVSFKDTPLPGTPIRIAKIFPTPVVYPSTNIIYLKTTPYFKINGTNFDMKNTALYFSPPLKVMEDVTVEISSPQRIHVHLLKKMDDSQRWAEEPGPIKLSAINTGAGALKLRPDLQGVTIGELQADLMYHGVKVETQDVKLYQSSKTITVAGSGFNPEGTRFRFFNPIKEGANYTAEVSENAAVLTLVEGTKWKLNEADLPSDLVLLAVDAGDDWVPVGANVAKAGRRVATIFEDPRVNMSTTEIMRTMSDELIVTGTGFTNTFSPIFVFEPAIDKDDYRVSVLNRTHVRLSLAKAGAGWMAEGGTGNLSVRAVNTGAGILTFNESVQVAVVRSDADVHESGINVKPNYNAVLYQSSNIPVVVDGQGFPEGIRPELTFGGLSAPDEDAVVLERVSDTRLKLSLVEGHTWASEPGPLFLTQVKFAETMVEFQSPGVKIATVLEDPIVDASQLHVYASHTKQINIKGRGFESVYDPNFIPKVVLSPTPSENYEVVATGCMNTLLTIGLKHSSSDTAPTKVSVWADVGGEDEIVDMKVISIDTGAGPVMMPGGGIVVAGVRMDDDRFHCEDSCIYANDGTCDEDQYKMLLNRGDSALGTLGASASSNPTARGYAGGPDESTMSESGDDMFLGMPRCEIGTDCTDCGFAMIAEGSCSNTCKFAEDEVCDDPRGYGVCLPGTDCKDCGPWGEKFTNFTMEDHMHGTSTGSVVDDFLVNDPGDAILEGQMGNGRGRYHRVFIHRNVSRKESEGGGIVLKDILWGAITLVGVTVTGVMSLLLFRYMKGERMNLPIPTNPDVESRR